MENVRAHGSFHEALRRYSQVKVSALAPENDPNFAKYIGDIANVLIESAALQFHLMRVIDNDGRGATLGKLQLLAFVHGFASPRRVTMYVKRMVQVGRLSYALDSSDRRVRRLVPSESLISTALDHVLRLCRSAELIWPDQRHSRTIVANRESFYRTYLNMGYAYMAGADPLRPFADVRHFTSKDAGTFLLAAAIHACLDGHERLNPATVFSLNYSELSRNLGVSRTHVRNVFDGAAARDLMIVEGEGGRSLRMTPKFISVVERYFACLLILVQTSIDGTGGSSRPDQGD